MPADVNQRVYSIPKYGRGRYAVWMKTITTAFTLEHSDAAAFRYHVLQVYYRHGWKAATEAFKVGKSTLYEWKHSYESSGKRAGSLVPVTTRPHNVRSMDIDARILTFIKALRQQYGNVSKYKIEPLLDVYAQEIGIASISATTIGKIIARNRLFFEPRQQIRRRTVPKRNRVSSAPKETVPGYVEMDSITLWILNHRYYFITVIDVVTKYAWCTITRSLTAKNAVHALEVFQSQYDHALRVVQTDNGHEFLGDFHVALESQHIDHIFIYPRSPKINGVVERFNRTMKEECIHRSDELFYDIPAFSKQLTTYLTWYNTKRPHYALKFQTPSAYLAQLKHFPESM